MPAFSPLMSMPVGAPKPEHHFEAAAPVDAHPDALDFNFRRETAENNFRSGMELERGRDQQQPRGVRP